MWGISILADFRPMGYKLSCCGSLWSSLGKNLLFKSALGHCDKCGHANGQTRKNVIETFLIVTHQKTNSSHHLTWPSEPWGGSGGALTFRKTCSITPLTAEDI